MGCVTLLCGRLLVCLIVGWLFGVLCCGVESNVGGLVSWLVLLCPLPVAYGWLVWRGTLCFRRSEPQGEKRTHFWDPLEQIVLS